MSRRLKISLLSVALACVVVVASFGVNHYLDRAEKQRSAERFRQATLRDARATQLMLRDIRENGGDTAIPENRISD